MAIVLKVEKREGAGKYAALRLRRAGLLPGVVYGRQCENILIQVPRREMEHLLESGERVLTLALEGKEQKAVLQDVQYGLFGGELLHVDFRAVAETDIIEMSVPLVVQGEAPGVMEGGRVEQSLFAVAVACLPKDLPERIAVDISGMKIGDVKYVEDLPALPGVRCLTPGRVAVVSIVRPVVEVEVAPAAASEDAAAPAEPEVIGEKERAEKAQKKEDSAKGEKQAEKE